MSGRSLVTCYESYLLSLKTCYASLEQGNPVPECIKDHVATLISDYVGELLEDHSPFCILGVGSGDGSNDLSFIEMLTKISPGRVENFQFFQRTIEPDENALSGFRAKAEDLPSSLKCRVDIDFEWLPIPYQEYVEHKKKVDVKFDVVHFFHSIYYVDVETALEHCYEKELGAKGVILCAISGEESAFVKYGKAFSSQGLILNPGAYHSSKEVTDVAKKNGWKYVECPGETRLCDIAIFDGSSVEGNHLLDFLTHWVNVSQAASQENLQKILNFWENECTENCHGKKKVKMMLSMVIIFKGCK